MAAAFQRAVVLDVAALSLRVDTEAPVVAPGPGELQVRVSHAALNPVDAKFAWWSSMLTEPIRSPFVLGVDGAGVVSAVGEGVTGRAVGDRVVFHALILAGAGSFAEYAVVQAAAVVPLPPTLGYAEAAAVPCAGWTAYKAVVTKLRAQAGQSIFITAGNGGVGGFAIQIAAAIGCNPIITTCSAQNNTRVLGLGATHTIDYHDVDVVEEIRKVVPEGVELAVDVVSAESATSLLQALAVDGQLACVAGVVTRGGEGDSYMKGWSVHDVALGPAAYFTGHPERLARIGTDFMALMTDGKISPMIETEIALEAVPETLSEVVSKGAAKGKIVVNIGNL